MATSLLNVLLLVGATLVAPLEDLMVRQTTAPADCAPYLHIITVRGTCAVYGQDNFQGLVPDIQARISGVNAIGLPYPANGDPARCPASYENSVNQGTTLLTQYIRDYASSCPKSKIGLIGYSQGAQVVMDTLCGTTEQPGRFTPTNPLPDNLASRISVAAVVADTTYIDGQGYDVGTAKNNGRNGRFSSGRNVAPCQKYIGRLQSWCALDDYFCDSGTDPNNMVHNGYFPRINPDIVNWFDYVV